VVVERCGQGGGGGGFIGDSNPKHAAGDDNDPAAIEAARHHSDECALADVKSGPAHFDTRTVSTAYIQRRAGALADPFALLRRHADVLAPDGMMLICGRTWKLEHHGTWCYVRLTMRIRACWIASSALVQLSNNASV